MEVMAMDLRERTSATGSEISTGRTSRGGVRAGVRSDGGDTRVVGRPRASRWLGRYVGLTIGGISIGGALLLWALVSARASSVDRGAQSTALFGVWHVSYDPPSAGFRQATHGSGRA